MADFASALYLGWQHGSSNLPSWASLSAGVPAAFETPGDHDAVGRAIAQLQGLEAGLIAPSSLHLFFDWFGLLDPRHWVVFADAYLYRVGQWGVERAAGRGVPGFRFRHQCAASLKDAFQTKHLATRRPVVVTDGWCPLCSRAAPLRDYLALLEPLDGLLVLDDTQALGVFGAKPNACPTRPMRAGSRQEPVTDFGRGGGGLLPHLGIHSPRVVNISSLAKAFGAPLAVLAGSRKMVADFKARSETRVYAGQPNAAAVLAAQRALALNHKVGDTLRERLFQCAVLFKNELAKFGLYTQNAYFPTQIIANLAGETARKLNHVLAQQGIRTVLVADHSGAARLCFLINAGHKPAQIQAVAQTTGRVLQNLQQHDNDKSIQLRHLAPRAGLYLPGMF